MEAGTLNCPMCGAPVANDSNVCEHCGARLAKVACPSCFGLIFNGSQFCPHCGVKVERVEAADPGPRACPRCKVNMEAVKVGPTNILECAKCEGLWVDNNTLKDICADREKQSLVLLGMPAPLPVAQNEALETIRYVPCPVCKELMNRINFANCSHVIVDVCRLHGTWFDKDELRKVIEFIRSGGMDQARSREIATLERERSLSKIDSIAPTGGIVPSMGLPHGDGWDLVFGMAIDVAEVVIKGLLK